MRKRTTALFLALLLLLSGCGGGGTAADAETMTGGASTETAGTAGTGKTGGTAANADTGTADSADSGGTEPLWDIGQTVHGFTLQSAADCGVPGWTLYAFTHDFSGAELAWIQCRDRELTFSAAFRTALEDETGANHVLEHAVLSSSEKYPSSDLGFDIFNKSYNSNANAYTYPMATLYPVSSRSGEQLRKLADAYMSCLAAPAVRTEENIFLREGLRYELDSPEGELSMAGTVFSEDSAYLTDVGDNACAHILDALYPGETASHMVSQSNLNYRDLTWEKALDAYEKYYRFDNCLLFLYGDLDCGAFLEMLDREYLSKAPRRGTELSLWEDGPTEPGHVRVTEDVPMFRGGGDAGAYVSYAVSLAGASLEDLLGWEILADVLNSSTSVLGDLLWERNPAGTMNVFVDRTVPKPYLCFQMSGADPSEMDEIQKLAEDVLRDLSRHGLRRELLEAAAESDEIDTLLLPDTADVGDSAAETVCLTWASFGRLDYFQTYNAVLADLSGRNGEKRIKELAKAALQSDRTALVASVPREGLAERYQAELAAYLTERKAAMSPSEREELAARTTAFRQWNETKVSNTDFLIDPADLPVWTAPAFTASVQDGISLWEGTADTEGIGSWRLDFDLSRLDREEIMDLLLYMDLVLLLDTAAYSGEELDVLYARYLHGFGYQLTYPGAAAGENHRPMLDIAWKGRVSDFPEGLSFLLHVLRETDLGDGEDMAWYLWQSAEDHNPAYWDGAGFAQEAALSGAGGQSDTYRFRLDADGSALYDRVTDLLDRLDRDRNAAVETAARFEAVREKAFTRRNVLFFSVTGPGEGVGDEAVRQLSGLPDGNTVPGGTSVPGGNSGMDGSAYTLPAPPPQRTAVCVEDAMQNTAIAWELPENGAYIPFVYALSDKYLLPRLRFQMGAYSAEGWCDLSAGAAMAYSASDPNAAATAAALYGLGTALDTLDIPPEEWDGYVLYACADLTRSYGALEDVMQAMRGSMTGDSRTADLINGARGAALSDRAGAAAWLQEAVGNGTLCTVGNEAVLRADADAYDAVLSYR